MQAKFLNIKVGDEVCLDKYPFKPFKVTAINRYEQRVVIECDNPKTWRAFSAKEFNDYGYVFANSL